jgi:hypothetical protein
MSTLTDLQAALPGKTITLNAAGGYEFAPTCSAAEWLTALVILDPSKGKASQGKLDIGEIPNWATWTQAQFATWCTNNLMTDAAVDASALSAALKTNVKAINDFVRNAGKLLIALRDAMVWLLKLNGVNGS